MSKTAGSFLGATRAHSHSKSRDLRSPLQTRVIKKYPNFYPGSVKPSFSPEMHLFYSALACVQYSIELIPKAEPLMEDIITQLDTPGCQKFIEKTDRQSAKFAHHFGKFIALYLNGKWYARLLLLPRFYFFIPAFVFSRDCRKLCCRIKRFIHEVFNRDPQKRRVIGLPHLYIIVLIVARFIHTGIDPYEHDREHRPLAADVGLPRPKSTEGRKLKVRYNSVLKEYEKHTDKYYQTGAKRWLFGRVMCKSVAEAESLLNLNPGQLRQEFCDGPFDEAMSYQKQH
jgi:hypothetical protein